MMDFCMKLLKAEWKVNQQEGEEEFKYYMIWQMRHVTEVLPCIRTQTIELWVNVVCAGGTGVGVNGGDGRVNVV